MVILDLTMPGLDTFSAVHEIRQLRPNTRIVILTSHSDRSLVARAREYKVNAYVLKNDPPEEMDYAIRSVLRGSFYIPPSLRQPAFDVGADGPPYPQVAWSVVFSVKTLLSWDRFFLQSLLPWPPL